LTLFSKWKPEIEEVFENRVMKIIFGPKRAKVTGERKTKRKFSFIICTLHLISLG
jgi:hypothetical protein